jgi:hypothetical protein
MGHALARFRFDSFLNMHSYEPSPTLQALFFYILLSFHCWMLFSRGPMMGLTCL